MAINNILKKCQENNASKIRHPVKLGGTGEKKNFNNLQESGIIAKHQLKAIGNYMRDYKLMRDGLMTGAYNDHLGKEKPGEDVKDMIDSLIQKGNFI
jgi:hypothetical protein